MPVRPNSRFSIVISADFDFVNHAAFKSVASLRSNRFTGDCIDKWLQRWQTQIAHEPSMKTPQKVGIAIVL